jgi:hypothetical protein
MYCFISEASSTVRLQILDCSAMSIDACGGVEQNTPLDISAPQSE